MKSAVMKWLHGDGRELRFGCDPAEFDVAAVRQTLRSIDTIFGAGRGYFPCEYVGLEQIPDEPCMVVMNHSGGTTIPDVWGFVVGWYRKFGTSRPLHVLGHEMIFSLEAPAKFFGRHGVIRATRDACAKVLCEHKRDVLVLPGGDRDTWRTYKRRFVCEFAGRTGYAQTALECSVPVVPVAHSGAHQTLMVLSDGHTFAKAVGIHKLARGAVFPIHLSLPYGLAIGPWPHIPVPSALKYRVSAPVQTAGRDRTQIDALVRASVQAGLDHFAQQEASRPTVLKRAQQWLSRAA
jgi:1-acyl-sn-glycerol-3-phosphate acyltransferase